MNIYLVRHGEAKPEHEAPGRPLSGHGRRAVEKLANAVVTRGISISEIFHSDKLRAKETAEILAQFISPERGIREMKGLSPRDDPTVARVEVEVAQEPLMLVGHLPHLGQLASMLVTGNTGQEIVDFPPAGIVCLARKQGVWEVRWTMSP